jgi:hypothetical protein
MSEKGKGLSSNDTRGGKRTVSPSHKVINLVNKPEGKPELTNQDGGAESLLAELRQNKQRNGRISKGF